MLVVSDATPLNFLVRLGAVHVLPALFDRVLVPPAVLRELPHPNTPREVREWMMRPPEWFAVIAPKFATVPPGPDAGEQEGIALALEMRADLLLADDRTARAKARKLGIRVTGTLGILRRAAERNLVNLHAAIKSLQAIGYFISPEVIQSLLGHGAPEPNGGTAK